MALSRSESRVTHSNAWASAAFGAAACLGFAGSSSAAEKAVIDAEASAEQTVEFNIYLPLRSRDGVESLLEQLHNPNSALYHQWLTPVQFRERFGPQASTITAVANELKARGLEVTEVHSHSLHVSGTAAAVQTAFGTSLARGHFASGKQVISAVVPIKLTPALAAAGAVIADFSGRIRMQKTSYPSNQAKPQNRESPTGGYWFDDLKQAYSFPSFKKLTGKGVTIGILMTGDINQPDMTA
jgi:subtilase family serine protease